MSLQTTHNTTTTSLQRELDTLRQEHQKVKVQLRELEMGNDDLERTERAVSSSLADIEAKYSRALEEKILLEHELLDKANLEEECQRLKDELRGEWFAYHVSEQLSTRNTRYQRRSLGFKRPTCHCTTISSINNCFRTGIYRSFISFPTCFPTFYYLRRKPSCNTTTPRPSAFRFVFNQRNSDTYYFRRTPSIKFSWVHFRPICAPPTFRFQTRQNTHSSQLQPIFDRTLKYTSFVIIPPYPSTNARYATDSCRSQSIFIEFEFYKCYSCCRVEKQRSTDGH